MFIVLEGLDGAGTTTQAERLAGMLTKKGRTVVRTQEPTGEGDIGQLLRRILKKEVKVSAEALQLLFCADRAEHLKNTVVPALERGAVVISDRYYFSTVAYGSLTIPDYEWLYQLNRLFLKPDLTFLLSVSPETCLERIRMQRCWRTF
ncbi:dTMP kinase [Candidatus Peregrinibacteria bacterium]|nr:MAG: dTMP kinase [Candidatus Peregrinibacteria bacterium]